MMHDAAHSIDVVEGATDEDNDVISLGLRAFNSAQTGLEMRPIPFSVFVRDESGTVQGGLIAQIVWGWLYVDKFWLPESLRRTGVGSAVLERAERWAMERGCRWSHLQTLDFQALPFYEGHGYVVFGALAGYPPPAGKRYYLRKTLSSE